MNTDALRTQLRALGEPEASVTFLIDRHMVSLVDDDEIAETTALPPATDTGD